jgi:hypothetical protein
MQLAFELFENHYILRRKRFRYLFTITMLARLIK